MEGTAIEETVKVRRTQAERSAGTRDRTLEAAIRCLYERGYGATTLLLVAQQSKISRGAMLHQFPTRTDLMLHVVRAVFDEEMQIYNARLKAIPTPLQRIVALPEIMWEVLSRPAGVAVLEILQGSRSDRELAARLAPLQAEIERESFAYIAHFEPRFGIVASPVMLRLVHWAIRGLSIAQLVTEEPNQIRESVDLLRRIVETFARVGDPMLSFQPQTP